MEIKGYTLHGDYYLADKVITNISWKKALKMKKKVTLPNGKTVIAHTLSKEELETIPKEERKCGKWYWTSSSYDSDTRWFVFTYCGFFYANRVGSGNSAGGARLGFKNPLLEEEQ